MLSRTPRHVLARSSVRSVLGSTPNRRSYATRMTNSEAFVETLASYDVDTTFGIVGSAFMDPLDLFPSAGIRFVSVQHEQNAVHMADGYSRVTDKAGVCISQNGPGITNYLTGVYAAYWAHSPVVCITPEGGTQTKGLGGFQEADQMKIFGDCTKWQGHVHNPARMAEITGRAFDYALYERGPTQLNIPRDYFYGENDFVIPKPRQISRGPGSSESLDAAADLIAQAKNPVLLVGGGVVMGNGVPAAIALAERLQVAAATTYLHNDAFPASHPLWTGPLGYQGHQASMNLIKDADLVIGLGTRISPFGTNPQYGIDYWPKDAKLIQVDADHRRLGMCKPADVAIHGDAQEAAIALLQRLEGRQLASDATTAERISGINQAKADWKEVLDEMTFGAPHATESGRMKPRSVLRELEKAMPDNAMVATDIGNVCSVSNSYLRFEQPKSMLAAMTFGNCGYSFPAAIGAKVARPDRPSIAYVGDGAWGMSMNETLTCIREKIPTTAVVFHNRQWGAEKKNQVLWFGDRYVGVQLENPSFSEIGKSMGAEGIRVSELDQVGDALRQSVKNQEEGKTTILELDLTRELGDPFRRDAMKLPQRILSKYQSTNRDEESSTGQPTDL